MNASLLAPLVGIGPLDIVIMQARRVFNGKGDCLAELDCADAWKAGRELPLGLVADVDGDERPEIILHHQEKILVFKGDKAARAPGLPIGTHNFTLY